MCYNFSMKKKEIRFRYLLNELVKMRRGISNTVRRNGYIKFPNDFTFFGYGKNNELNDKFLCYTPNLKKIAKLKKSDVVIVSGVGATNPPTMGTMSEILKLLDLQRKTHLYLHFIVNDLGSINARNILVGKVLNLTKQYINFIKNLGFDELNGEIVTHNDLDHQRIFSLVAREISLSDFNNNTEVTDETYDRLELRGRDFPVLIDHVFTATDVLYPIIKHGKRGIVVVSGLDEFYHANIGGIALERMKNDKELKKLIPRGVQVGAIYSRIIRGVYPYFKQSKSIPSSSVNLGQSEQQIKKCIMDCGEKDEKMILEMIELSSPWDRKTILDAKNKYKNRRIKNSEWLEVKKAYLEEVLRFKDIWNNSAVSEKDVMTLLFDK